jgi:hypothetical protein
MIGTVWDCCGLGELLCMEWCCILMCEMEPERYLGKKIACPESFRSSFSFATVSLLEQSSSLLS